MFSEEWIKGLLPRKKIEAFFEAFYFGEEPAYDLELGLGEVSLEQKRIRLDLRLLARPGRCLACNLTWGLPPVLEKHPLLNLEEIVRRIEERLPEGLKVKNWELGAVREINSELHVIPLWIYLK